MDQKVVVGEFSPRHLGLAESVLELPAREFAAKKQAKVLKAVLDLKCPVHGKSPTNTVHFVRQGNGHYLWTLDLCCESIEPECEKLVVAILTEKD